MGRRHRRTLFSTATDANFDAWLERRLGELHKDVLDEPLPRDVEELARELDARLKAGRKSNGAEPA